MDDLLKEAELRLKRKLKARHKIAMVDVVAQKQMQDHTNSLLEAEGKLQGLLDLLAKQQ